MAWDTSGDRREHLEVRPVFAVDLQRIEVGNLLVHVGAYPWHLQQNRPLVGGHCKAFAWAVVAAAAAEEAAAAIAGPVVLVPQAAMVRLLGTQEEPIRYLHRR